MVRRFNGLRDRSRIVFVYFIIMYLVDYDSLDLDFEDLLVVILRFF